MFWSPERYEAFEAALQRVVRPRRRLQPATDVVDGRSVDYTMFVCREPRSGRHCAPASLTLTMPARASRGPAGSRRGRERGAAVRGEPRRCGGVEPCVGLPREASRPRKRRRTRATDLGPARRHRFRAASTSIPTPTRSTSTSSRCTTGWSPCPTSTTTPRPPPRASSKPSSWRGMPSSDDTHRPVSAAARPAARRDPAAAHLRGTLQGADRRLSGDRRRVRRSC